MIVDSSAIIAVIGKEPGYERILRKLAEAGHARLGTPTRLEAGMVLTARFGSRGKTVLARFIQESNISAISFDEAHAAIALDAFTRYGKGRHPAGLNFGDCCSYATAVVAREPLLCIGDDFPQTDLELVPLDD